MKICYILSDISFPPEEGMHQQTLLLIRGLVASGDELIVMGFVKARKNFDIDALAEYLGLETIGPFIQYRGPVLGLAVANSMPGWMISRRTRRMRKLVRSARPDVLHLDGTAASALFRFSFSIPTVASFIDPGSRRQRRLAELSSNRTRNTRHRFASLAYFWIEARLANSDMIWHVVSWEDRDYLQSVHGHFPVVAVPIMIPPEFEVLNHEQLDGVKAGVKRCPEKTRILVYADMRRSDMRAAIIEMFKITLRRSQRSPSCVFTVLGRVAMDVELEDATSGFDCEFLEWVSDYVAVIRACDVVILPDKVGTGIKNRAIQALAAGKAVIGTEVAFEGIPRSSPEAFQVVRSWEIASSLDSICSSEELRVAMGRRAAELAYAEYSAESVIRKWRETHDDAARLQTGD